MCYGMGCEWEHSYTGECTKPRWAECPAEREVGYDEEDLRRIKVLSELTGIDLEYATPSELENIERYLESVGVDLECMFDNDELPEEDICSNCENCYLNEVRDLSIEEWKKIMKGEV